MYYLTHGDGWWQVKDSYYLLLRKNGCSSILQNFSPHRINESKNPDFPKWTIIRDPMKRFISGLAYDMEQIGLDKAKKLENFFIKNPQSLVHGNYHAYQLLRGFGAHTYMQSFTLINKSVNYVVKLEELTSFIEIHNDGVYDNRGQNPSSKEANEYANFLVSKMNQSDLENLFYVENKIYHDILNSELLWKWQYGNIF